MFKKGLSRGFLFIFLLSSLFFLNGCQESSLDDNGNDISSDKHVKSGKVAVVLTDAPNDEFSEINVTITRILLLSEDEESQSDSSDVVIFEGEQTINLLALENYSNLFALSNDVPVGIYHKIRLSLKKEGGIELVKRDDVGEITELHYPKLNGNAKLDLKANIPFEVVADSTLIIQMDIDAKKSINISQTGKGEYKFRPVIFVDVITPEFSGKLVRHSGFVRNLDLTNEVFHLCQLSTPDNDSSISELCLLVHINEVSSFEENGDIVNADYLDNDQVVTVFGYLESASVNTGSIVEFGQLLAQVLHVGEQAKFEEVDGVVNTLVDEVENSFDMRIGVDAVTSVFLQDDTRVFLRDGTETTIATMTQGDRVEVHGVFDFVDGTTLNATLIILEPKEQDLQKITGSILDGAMIFPTILLAAESGDRVLRIADDAVVLSVSFSSGEFASHTISTDSITSGVNIEAYGVENATGEFLANIILVITE